MTLADYCLPGADPDLQEPLAGRLLKVLDHFGGSVMILSGRRSTAQQWVLYNRRQEYLKNPEKWIAEHPGQSIPAHAAYPGTSKHEDGDAADLDKDDDVTWGAVHYTGHAYGVHFPIPDEDWHAEAIPDWVDPEPEEWDMTDDDMRKLAGFIAEALDARPRKTHSYRDGNDYTTNARTMEEWRQEEIQQATLAAQGKEPK